MMGEPLLIDDDNPQTFTLFPIKRKDVWAMYKQAQRTYWLVEEVNLDEDITQWELTLDEKERRYLSHVLAFFACGDGVVSLNLVHHFMQRVKCQETLCFYSFQNTMETIHAEMYSTLIDELIKDSDQKGMLLNAVATMPSVAAKIDWVQKWIESGTFAEQIVAMAIFEGVYFASSFASIFWFRSRGLMPGLVFSNELISRDEALHCQFACLLYRRYVVGKLSRERIVEIFREAVDIEKAAFREALPEDLVGGMNAREMGRYVEFVADELCKDLGYAAIFDADNPFDFMESSALENKTNFFERKVSDYQKSGLYRNKSRFVTDADF
jgi:ribonucleoside-diphosphate reductase beta chain